MNKKTIKIAGWALGLSMAVAGIGVAAVRAYDSNIASTMASASETANWTATSGGLGSGIGSGTFKDSENHTWSYERTLSSGSSYSGWTSDCIQLGKNGGVENLTLSTTAISGTINSVSIECASYQGKHNVAISVGGTSYLKSTATSSWTTVSTKSGTGTSSGEIVITFTGGTRALYVKSLTVEYTAAPAVEESDTTSVTLDATYGEGESMSDFYEMSSFTLDATLSEGSTSKIAWSREGESTATATITPSLDTLSATIAATSSGTLKIKAQAVKSDGETVITGINATYTVTVKVNAPTSVSITEKTPFLELGGSLQLTATVDSAHGNPSQAVTWSSSDPSVATIDSEGNVTTVAVGTTKIKATAAGYASVYDDYDLTVYNPIYKMVTSISDLSNGDTVVIGAYHNSTWYAMGRPSTSAPSSGYNYWKNLDTISLSDYKFNESALSNASFWTYSATDGKSYFQDQENEKYLGAASASNNYKAGEYAGKNYDGAKWTLAFDANGVMTMTNDASTTIDYVLYGGNTPEFQAYSSSTHTTSNLRLFKCAGAGIAATSATTSVESATVTAGKEISFTYAVVPGFNTDTLTISSSDDEVMTVSVSGNAIEVHGVAAGSANVLIKNSADSTIKSVPVTVNEATIYDHITVNASTMTKKTYTIGDDIELSGVKAYAYMTADDSGDPVDVTLETEFVSSPAKANAVNDALAITVTGTFKNGDDSDLADSDSVNVVVNPILATGVELTYAKSAYEVGSIATPTAIGVINNDATDKTVTVTSSNPTVIRVNNASTGEIEFLKAGSARITAAANDGSGQSAYVDLTSNFIYPIDRYITTNRLSGLTASYTSSSQAFDGINYSWENVLKNSNKLQIKASTGVLQNNSSLGGVIKSITLSSIGGTGAISVLGSADGSSFESISGSDGVYTPANEKLYSYFKIQNTSSNMVSVASIKIEMRGDFNSHVNSFASAFNSAVGDNCATFSPSLWSGLETSFNELTEDEKAACASNTVTDLANGEGTILDQAMRRYDNIVKNYSMSDFIGRSGDPSPSSTVNEPFASSSSNDTAFIMSVVVCGTLVVAGGGLAFLARRSKED